MQPHMYYINPSESQSYANKLKFKTFYINAVAIYMVYYFNIY